MAEVRLQKFLAECGVGSRRKMEEFIVRGRVRVNGQVVTELGRKVDPDQDRIEVNRKPIHAAPKGIMLLNKPRGVVSTLSDPEGRRSIADFLTKKQTSYFPVGRLDWDSTGLMVLTNDGEVAERLMHPRFGFERVYEARVEGAISQGLLDKLARGIKVSDGMIRATAEIMSTEGDSTWVQVRISEGRNRIVRRIFDKLGHPVMKLKRTVYGPFKLGRLQVGQVRALTQEEYEQARRKVMNYKAGEAQEKSERPARAASREGRESVSPRGARTGAKRTGPERKGRPQGDARKPRRVRRRD
jgi:23S rRNA pseudouridine2605 synthase